MAEEIIPVTIPQRRGDDVVVERDEHPRADSSLEALGKLPAAFREGGSVTAGNSSGVNDGAAALVIASEAAAKEHGLQPRVRILGMASAGVEPRLMGRKLGLSPLVVVLSLLFWNWVWGPAGMLLSVPLTVMVKIILEGREGTRWIGVLLGPEVKARQEAGEGRPA